MLRTIFLLVLFLPISFIAQAQKDSFKVDNSLRETAKASDNNEDSVYTSPDVLPDFGADIFQYLANKMKYPKEARKKKIEGRVFLSYIVNKKGYVTNVIVEKGIGYGLDEVAKKAIESLPRYKSPAMHNEKPVSMKFLLPITFSLQ